jgi:hypothetical protein
MRDSSKRPDCLIAEKSRYSSLLLLFQRLLMSMNISPCDL